MKRLTAIATALSVLATTPAHAQPSGGVTSKHSKGASLMEIYRNGSRRSVDGASANFTGPVRIEPIFDANEASAVSAARVTFQPGARSAWHTHPKGQRLIVTEGTGWTQVVDGPVEEIRAGDVIWCPPGVKHWHGATPTTAMTHIAVQEAVDGTPVEWMEHVTDEQYRR